MRRLVAVVFLACLFMFVGVGSTAACEPPAAPKVNLEVNGLYVYLSWDWVANASGYKLYYATYPDRTTWAVMDLGNVNEAGFWLQKGEAFYFMVRAYNACGESDNIYPSSFVLGVDTFVGLACYGRQIILKIKAWGMWCDGGVGDVNPLPAGTVFYLHSHLKNKVDLCNNVLATGIVDNKGWVKFVYDNPVDTVDPLVPPGTATGYVLDRHWITNQYCTGGGAECHLWITTALEDNPYYRPNCDGNPELVIMYYAWWVSPVPPDTPCTVVGVNCLD